MKTHQIFQGSLFIALILFGFLPLKSAQSNQQTTAAAVGNAIGQVVWVKGVVKATGPDQTTRTLTRRSPIYVKDTIETTENSTGEVVFSDNSIVALRSDTQLRIDDYQFGKNVEPSKVKYIATLVKGGFRTLTGLIPKENSKNYQVNTPVATIGVRGTEYAVSLGKNNSLDIMYFKGTPCFTGAKDGSTTCLDYQNRFYQVDQSGAVTRLPAMPATFREQPNLTSSDSGAAGLINGGSGGGSSGGGSNSGGSSSGGGSAGGPPGQTGAPGGPVKGFCIQ